MISDTKKLVSESCQKVVYNTMEVMVGIDYTNVFPIERMYRDLRMASRWMETNEVMSMIVVYEWYHEYFAHKKADLKHDYAFDAAEAIAPDKKIYQ